MLPAVGQHALQLRSVGAAGAYAAVGELLDDDGAKLLRFATAGVALSGNRVALRFAVRATFHLSLHREIENAGAVWVNEETVVDGSLIVARIPAFLPALLRALLRVLEP